jgi:hypothetical protein
MPWQTKTVATATSLSSGWVVTSGSTSSNSRTFARLARHTRSPARRSTGCCSRHSDQMNRKYVRFGQPRSVLVGPSKLSSVHGHERQSETHIGCRAETLLTAFGNRWSTTTSRYGTMHHALPGRVAIPLKAPAIRGHSLIRGDQNAHFSFQRVFSVRRFAPVREDGRISVAADSRSYAGRLLRPRCNDLQHVVS